MEPINPHPPVIDGKLSDEVWKKGEWSGNFIQRKPYEGKSPFQETAFKILYDEENLYIAIQAYDSDIKKISRRMSRRDNIEGDYVTVNIDSNNDKLTAYTFKVSAAGVKGDEVVSENGMISDDNWDPIWNVKTSVNENGWIAEIRIPFSQLRFGKNHKQIWGLQVSRNIFRKGEESNWQPIPRNASTWVHHLGLLKGLKGIKQGKKIELLPYAVGKLQRFEPEEGNPFVTGKLNGMMGGLDGKIGISSNMTLNFTINPDFGQVEADPSQVNLTAFETYFEEKRPFFIEGRNIFNYQLTIGDGDFSQDNLFYSRRIGRRPQYCPETEDGKYIDIPENTSILGAFKLTGKTRKGLSIGIINSTTADEKATIGNFQSIQRESVEPLTNYFGLRLQQDFNNGNTIIGGMFTGVHRNIKNPNLNFLHRGAYSGGLDLYHTWKKKEYFLSLKMVFSHVYGDKEAIINTQESPLRYYQRPDAKHISFDPDRTSLSGYGGDFTVGKLGKGNLRYIGGLTWRSPGLELNDMGYLRYADVIMGFYWIGYRITKPFGIFKQINFNFNQWQGWDFSKESIFKGGNINVFTQFKNFWSIGASLNLQGINTSRSTLRGGPSLELPRGNGYWLNISSDSRKKLQFRVSGGIFKRNFNHYDSKSISAGLTFRPSNSISISAHPSYNISYSNLQYVETFEYNQENRYVLASINQKTIGITFRMNLSLTPELSIQFYGMPYVSVGQYSNYKYITAPRAKKYTERFSLYGGKQLNLNEDEELYSVDEDMNGAIDYSFENPNFNFLQFQSNLVIRWEYKPGSAIYVVWSQGRTDCFTSDNFSISNNMHELFNLKPHNVFLIKFTHRFSM